MATFVQFLRKHPARKNWYYVCGEEKLLVEDVVRMVVEMFDPDPRAFSVLDAKESVGNVMAALASDSPFPTRTIVLRNAQLLTEWDRVHRALNDRLRLLVVTDERNPKTTESRYRPFVEKGQFVECSSMERPERMFDYVSVLLTDMEEGAVQYLVDRYEEDFPSLRNLVQQLLLFPKPTGRLVRTLTEYGGAVTFASALISGGKKEAVRVLPRVPRTEYLVLILRSLERELVREMFVVDALRQGLRGYDLYQNAGVPRWALPHLLERIDKERVDLTLVQRRIRLVAHTALLVDRGETLGVLERLLHHW
jgi:DNA polymerase III delta subunit